MKILGIETSCDDTAAAVLDIKKDRIKVLSNVISSQIKLHSQWGGVVPRLATREHAKNINKVVNTALLEAKTKIQNIDRIAVTSGPGLMVSLLIGTTFAKALSWKYQKPVQAVNHMEGHIYSNWLSHKIKQKHFPALCLVVSGGHTQIMLMSGHGKYKIIGETLDDAAGEAFDKIARILDLGYPGGPIVSKLAKQGNPEAFALPRPMLDKKNYDFSFSGLKTAVLYLVRDIKATGKKITPQIKKDICASAQQAIIDSLITKTVRAAEEYKIKSIMLSGGVAANKLLRETLQIKGKELKIPVFIPDLKYTTDNAAMIAIASYFNPSKNKKTTDSWRNIIPNANWEIG